MERREAAHPVGRLSQRPEGIWRQPEVEYVEWEDASGNKVRRWEVTGCFRRHQMVGSGWSTGQEWGVRGK